MAIQKFYRLANVSLEEAIDGLKKRFPGSEVISFNKKGNQYVAELKMPAGEPDMDEPSKDDMDLPDLDEGMGDEGEGPEDEEKEEHEDGDKDSKIIDMLQKIMDHLHIKSDEEEGEHGPDLAGGDLPDVGAPPAGEPMPPKLPEPAPNPKANRPGGPAFSSHMAKVEGKHTFTAYRKQASELDNKGLVAEAQEGFPGYQVVKLDRISKAQDDVAIITLQKKNR